MAQIPRVAVVAVEAVLMAGQQMTGTTHQTVVVIIQRRSNTRPDTGPSHSRGNIKEVGTVAPRGVQAVGHHRRQGARPTTQ